MSQILCSDWLPEQARGAILPAQSYLLCPTGKFSKKSHVINPLLTKIVQSRHLDIGLIFCEFMDLDPISVHGQTQKRTWPPSSHLDLMVGQ